MNYYDTGDWFSVDVKEPLAYANVEVIEAAEMKPSDLNGLADPYVKGHLGQYRFRTQIQRKTLTPKWQEEIRVPICSWDTQNVLAIEVHDKDHFLDDFLGNCSVNINDLRDGQRHDMWLSLENVKLGRLHLAVTVVDSDAKGTERNEEKVKIEGDQQDSFENQMTEKEPVISALKVKTQKFADTFEAIDVEGQKETGIWVHHPGSEVSQAWEPRKGKIRHLDTEIQSMETPKSCCQDSGSSEDENKVQGGKLGKAFQKGFSKIFHRQQKDDLKDCSDESIPSPHDNVKAAHYKKVGVNLVVDVGLTDRHSGKATKSGGSSGNEGSGAENAEKHLMKARAKKLWKNAGHSARHLKQALSRKGSSKFLGESEQAGLLKTDSESDDESLTSTYTDQSVKEIPITSTIILEHHAQNVSAGTVTNGNEVSTTAASSDVAAQKEQGSK